MKFFNIVLFTICFLSIEIYASDALVLDNSKLKAYVDTFNANDEELYANISNKDAFSFLKSNIPLFECPDKDFERTYYFRWWTYRKHIKETPDGYVVTEFLPKVRWSGKHNTISCPVSHHIYEGRWLRDSKYLDDYSVFWFRKGGWLRSYSNWIADAVYARYLVNKDEKLITDLLDDLVKNYREWENMRLVDDGMFWQIDDRDGMEASIGRNGKRATINSYMYGDALAISRIADMAGRFELAKQFRQEALRLRNLVHDKLWDPEAKFFKTLTRSQREIVTPKNSHDHWAPKLHWAGEYRGTLEWVQYTFKKPRNFDAAEVYWYSNKHAIVPPVSWRILVQSAGEWKPVINKNVYGTKLDIFNRVEFAPVKADAIRLEVQSGKGKSAGIFEWRLLEGKTNHAPDAQISTSFEVQRSRNNYVNALNDAENADTVSNLVDVREQHGFTPWYFNLPEKNKGYEVAWKQLMDPKGFYAPFGPTTAEQRHPGFRISYEGHECQWNGPSWPLSTSVTLTALANVLNNYPQDVISKKDYFETLKIYTKSHRLKRENGEVVPWIDENLNPFTGDWIARTRLKSWKNGTWDDNKGGKERGKDYNHSTYNDLIITGLVGLRPRPDNIIEVNPLLPENTWDWFCLDNVLYQGKNLTIIWDKTGKKYGKGKGLSVFSQGKKIAGSDKLTKILAKLN